MKQGLDGPVALSRSATTPAFKPACKFSPIFGDHNHRMIVRFCSLIPPMACSRNQNKSISPSNNPPDDPFGTIMAVAEEMHRLAKIAVLQYTPVVEGIISSKSKDVHHIKHTLDGLLDFGFYDPMVELFRRLCRYYYFIDAAAAANYVLTYREMWDSEESKEPPLL